MFDQEQYAYFGIIWDFDPGEINNRLGVAPTSSWRKGERNPRTNRAREFSLWELRSRLDNTAELEAHIRDVLAQLDQNPSAFLSVSNEFQGWLQLVGYFWKGYPGLHFDLDIVEGLARYKLEVDFDFYFSDAEEREDSNPAGSPRD